jgi:ATP-dependent Lon protease
VVLPKLNEDQLGDLPPGLSDEVHVVLVDRIEQVLDAALAGAATASAPGRG